MGVKSIGYLSKLLIATIPNTHFSNIIKNTSLNRKNMKTEP